MSFNQFMHPRNPFKIKPDYKLLANKYESFKNYLVPYSSGNKFKINFDDPNALRCLSAILLKDKFDLDIHIPLDRLIPSIPQRVNYILWVEDLLNNCFNELNLERFNLIDCGTGASCVFPLISIKMNQNWHFLATELDDYSLEFARKNCEVNQLDNQIKVIKGKTDQLIPDLIESTCDEFHALMCNPPFFDAKDEEGKQSLANTSILVESTVEGGEESFILKLIEESFVYKNKIKLFTVMLGRKSSFKNLKKKLQSLKADDILNFIDTEFCQGKTIRWGLCWTFDQSLNLSATHQIKHLTKKNPIFEHKIPENKFIYSYSYTLNGVTNYILELLDNIQISKIHLSNLTKFKHKIEFNIKTNLNTWSHQRRKRRLAQRVNESNSPLASQIECAIADQMAEDKPSNKRLLDELECDEDSFESDCFDHSADSTTEHQKRTRTSSISKDDQDDEFYLLNCSVRIQQKNEKFYLKITANHKIKDKDSAHQLFQYLKNNL